MWPIPACVRPTGRPLYRHPAHSYLDKEAGNAYGNQGTTASGNDEPDLQRGILKMAHAPRYAHQAQDVQGCKGSPKSNQPEPERTFTPKLIQPKTKGFRKPIVYRGKNGKDHTANNHVVKMGNQE